jgi:hypothetical protein
MTTTQNTRPTATEYPDYATYLIAKAAYEATPAGIAEQAKENARTAKAAAKQAMREINRSGIEYATEAQISYLTTLLPRFYSIQAADGITVETAVWEANGAIKTAALSKLTKSEASAWISAAKEEINAA